MDPTKRRLLQKVGMYGTSQMDFVSIESVYDIYIYVYDFTTALIRTRTGGYLNTKNPL
jgi:hypothetical protein